MSDSAGMKTTFDDVDSFATPNVINCSYLNVTPRKIADI